MADKKRVHIEKVCPYSLNECLNLMDYCDVRDIEDYSKRQKESQSCHNLGDKLDNRGWVGKFKMVATKHE